MSVEPPRGLLVIAMLRCRRGVTALEYGLIAGLIAVVLLVGAGQMGTNISNTLSHVASHITY